MIPAAGGPVRVLCSGTGSGGGGTWNPSGVIVFGSERGPLRRVDAAGGPCVVVGTDDARRSAQFPVFLPDGHHFLYRGATADDGASRGVYLAALDDAAELAPRKILADNSSVVYAPAAIGRSAHLLFLRDATLMAQPFNDATLVAVGDPFPVASQAGTDADGGVAASVSKGTLVYLTGNSHESQLTWLDRSGRALGTVGPRTTNQGVVLSPDGQAVLINRGIGNGMVSLWLYDLVRGVESRFAPPGALVPRPVWFPDGRRVLIRMAGPPGGSAVYEKDASGGDSPVLVSPTPFGPSFSASAFSPDGRFLVYTVVDTRTQADIWYVPWDGKPDFSKAVKFLATDAAESQGQVSSDGKWIAYTSNETGDYEVYVRPFPTGPGGWKVSVDQGFQPRWSADGKRIYYLRRLNGQRATLLAATVESDASGRLRTGPPQKQFDVHGDLTVVQANAFSYSPHPDGQRFLVSVLVEDSEPTINVITHWQQSIPEQKAP